MNHHQKLAYYFILALCSSSFLALFTLLLFFLCRNHPHRQLPDETPPPAKPSARPHTLIDIYTATEGFSHRRVIGEGRLGTVYAALSETGELIAVKRIYPWLVLSNNNAGFGFSSVIKSLSSAQHPNLISITGYSEAPGERIIVMEYAGVVNLDMYLHQNPDGAFLLDWKHRVKIAAGAARGLQYLHESMAPSVIHGCVKSSNILIDAEFIPKLSDYGLNYLAAREKRGLVGYVDDEYWKGKGGQGNCKENDVYGFGVVLLELLSGRGCEEGWLVKWALPLIKEMRFSEVLDPRIEYPSDLKPLMRMGKVALACVGNCRKSRPVIGQVVAILNNLETQNIMEWLLDDKNEGSAGYDAFPSRICPSCAHPLEVEVEVEGGFKVEDWGRLPAGVKFDPSDQQILEHLEAKVKGDKPNLHPLIHQFIPTLDGKDGICYTHPQYLPGMKKDGEVRHFFHRPSKAYTAGTRKRRKVKTEEEEGRDTRWHKTGKTRAVGGGGGGVMGFKKILVLYSNYGNRRKAEKTNWIMHQYHLGVTEQEKDGQWVASKVFFQLHPRQTSPIFVHNPNP